MKDYLQFRRSDVGQVCLALKFVENKRVVLMFTNIDGKFQQFPNKNVINKGMKNLFIRKRYDEFLIDLAKLVKRYGRQ